MHIHYFSTEFLFLVKCWFRRYICYIPFRQMAPVKKWNNSWWTTFKWNDIPSLWCCSFVRMESLSTIQHMSFMSISWKFIVFKRTPEVRWYWCSFSFFDVVFFFLLLLSLCVCIASAFQIHYTPNDIDFNFINKTQRLNHFTNKYLERCYAHKMEKVPLRGKRNKWPHIQNADFCVNCRFFLEINCSLVFQENQPNRYQICYNFPKSWHSQRTAKH